MEKTRQIKILSIVALVVAIAGMTLGFAAFSTTLSISSSATVTPNSEDFKVVMLGSETDLSDTTATPKVYYGATAEESLFNNYNGGSSVSLKANFTNPGQYVMYKAYIHNLGEYYAYFDKIIFENVEGTSEKKKCTPVAGGGATLELVEQACESIKIIVVSQGNIEISDSFNLTGIGIPKGEVGYGHFKIIYEEGGVRVDGPFTVEFGDVKIIYSTIDT